MFTHPLKPIGGEERVFLVFFWYLNSGLVSFEVSPNLEYNFWLKLTADVLEIFPFADDQISPSKKVGQRTKKSGLRSERQIENAKLTVFGKA